MERKAEAVSSRPMAQQTIKRKSALQKRNNQSMCAAQGNRQTMKKQAVASAFPMTMAKEETGEAMSS